MIQRALLLGLLASVACGAEPERMPAVPPAGFVPVIQSAFPISRIYFGCEGEDERSVTVSVRVRPDGTPADVWITSTSELQGADIEACYRSNLMAWRWMPAENALGERVPYVWTETFTVVG